MFTAINKRRVAAPTASSKDLSSSMLLLSSSSQHQSSDVRNFYWYNTGSMKRGGMISRNYIIWRCIVITIIVVTLILFLTVLYPPPKEISGHRRHKFNNNNNDTPIRYQEVSRKGIRKQQQRSDTDNVANTIISTINNNTITRIWDTEERRKLSNRQFDIAINVVEDVGIYRFLDTPDCSSTTGSLSCYIYFPTSYSDHSCLVTLKGSKSMQQIDEEDDEGVTEQGNQLEEDVGVGTRKTEEEQIQPKSIMLPNQDRIVLLTFTPQQQQQQQQKQHSKVSHPIGFIAGLFDGHGDYGHYSSQLASTELLLRFLQQKQQQQQKQQSTATNNQQENLLQHIDTSFVELDDSIAMKSILGSGTTAVMVWQIGLTVYISSCGDSSAYLIQWNGDDSYTILKSAVKHKPSDPDERTRIEKAGTGMVLIPPPEMTQMSSRVVFTVPMLDRNNQPTGMQAQMGIAMSRSLGDIEAKERNLLIANPTTLSIDLQQYEGVNDMNRNFFVILGTDGIFDVLSNDQIIIPIGKALYDENNDKKNQQQQQPNSLHITCNALLQEAKQRWADETQNSYRDDISLLVHRIVI